MKFIIKGFLNRLSTKERSIGSTSKKRRYDLALNKSDGSGFLILLIGLMTFLAMMALTASFTLNAMTDRWSSGLENKVTVEIPAKTVTNTIRSTEQMRNMARYAHEIISKHPVTVKSHILTQDEITELVEPWLGNNVSLEQIPLPMLIAVETTPDSLDKIKDLERTLKKSITPNIRIDTHEQWLTDLMKFTGALKMTSILLGFIIGLTTIIAVAGAVKSRIAIHEEEVELLHLIGASDNYIANQFQRYIIWLTLQGSISGAIISSLIIFLIGWTSGQMNVNLLPEFQLETSHMIMLGLLPFSACLITAITARKTVVKALTKMP